MNTREKELNDMAGPRIEKWLIMRERLMGVIYDDPLQRFNDGDHVTTSTILEEYPTVVRTRNTVYKLGEKSEVG